METKQYALQLMTPSNQNWKRAKEVLVRIQMMVRNGGSFS